jgi:Uma2 family endonuclease
MSIVASHPEVAPSLHMTEEQFWAWAMGDGAMNGSAEWVGELHNNTGKVVIKVPIDWEHDRIQSVIKSVIQIILSRKRLGVAAGPQFSTRMNLQGRRAIRDPDVMVIGNDKLSQLKPTRLEGPPDVAVEIVSPDSETRDFIEKFAEYQEAGVQEYWIINPLSKQIHLYVLSSQGRFEKVTADASGRFQSQFVPGFWLHPDDVFDENTRDPIALLRKIDPSLLEA